MTKDGVLYLGINYDSSKDEWTEWALGKYHAGKSGGSYTLPSFVTGICAFAFEGCKFSEIHIPVQVSEFYEDWMASLTEDKVYHPFENMAVQSTMYVVKNSYADWEYGGGAYSPLKYENGPAVKIRYVLNGGKNNSANPATIPGGTTLKLSNPTRTGYKFVGWKVAGGSDDHKITEITPDSDELCKGVVSYAVEAIWKETVPAAGSTYKLSAGTFKIVTKVKDSKAGSVAFTKAKNKSSVTVPATVKIKGKTYKVTQIRAKAFTGKRIRKVTIGKNVKIIKKYAFKGSKATKLIFKTKLLKKSKVKGCLKGSKVKTIQIKLGKKSLNKKYVKLYKKYFTKANAGRKVTIKM